MATLTVGTGQQYATIAAAVAASHNGDVIQVQAGTYTNDFSTIKDSITIEGVGGMVNLVASELLPTQKGILTIGGGASDPTVTLEGLAISGAAISAANGGNAAGIRYQTGNLTIDNSYIFGNQDGLWAGNNATGAITINDSEFAGNGTTSTATHNISVGEVGVLNIRGSYITAANSGTEIQSLALVNNIINNRIVDGPTATASFSVALPHGGSDTISDNTIEQGPKSDNPTIVTFGSTTTYSGSNLTISNNTILNDEKVSNARAIINHSTLPVSFTGNSVYGLTSAQIASGPVTVSGTTFLTSEPVVSTAPPYNSTGSAGTVLTVGPGQEYSTLGAAVAASRNGDLIQVQAGTYTNDFSDITDNITIEGVGGMADFVATVPPSNLKGILTIGGSTSHPTVTLQNLELSGAAISAADGGNGAGIRYQSGNLTINNSYIYDNQDGLLADADATGSVTINNSEFAFNGSGTGFTHNIYVGDVANFTMTNSYVHDASVGHEVKSRAENTTITGSRIFDNSGTASYSIDLPNGGNASILNDVIEQGPNTQNPNIIAYGEEGGLHTGTNVLISNDTIVNDDASGSARGVWNAGTVPLIMQNDKVYGLTSSQLTNGPVTTSGITFLTTRPTLSTSSPWTAPAPAGAARLTGGTADNVVAATTPDPTTDPSQIAIATGDANPVELVSNRIISATAGNHMSFIGGTGANVLHDSGSDNTIIMPGAGQGFDDVFGYVLQNGDTLDFRAALGGTAWNGDAASVGGFLHVAQSGDTTLIPINTTVGGSAMNVAQFEGSGTVSLTTLLAHSTI